MKRHLLKAVTGALIVLYIVYHLTGNQQSEAGTLVYPNIRFVGGGHQGEAGGIPRIIHQTWKTDEVPGPLEDWVASWRRYHPDWEYWFWTDDDARRLVDTAYPHFRSLFSSYPEAGYRADALRYFVLHMHGGVYADLDMECLRPLDDVISAHDCILSQEPEEHAHFLSPVGVPLVSNALMACRAGHPFFNTLIDRLPAHTGWLQWYDVLHATGPYMLTAEYHRYRQAGYVFPGVGETSPVHLAPPEQFQPLVDTSMLGEMRRNCMPGHPPRSYAQDFVRTQRRLCDIIRDRSLTDVAPPGALTVHHFTHLWAGPRYDPRGVFNSRQTFRVHERLTRNRSA